MKITDNFTGGNIVVEEQSEDAVYLSSDQRDTVGDWFYWAFCVEGAQGKTVTFWFTETPRVGYYGPAISHDLKEWKWLWDKPDSNGMKFTYTFGEDESKVYFAHHMLYHPDRFYQFAEQNGLTVEEFCESRKGRSVPSVTIGSGSKSIILTSRHHACESTGSYVLEGVLGELLKNPIPDTKVLCVPFMDIDGVIEGDQGKNRAPHDHARDYSFDEDFDFLYPETTAMRAYAAANGCHYGFDFHAPAHWKGENDTAFVSRKSTEPDKVAAYEAFAAELEAQITPTSFQFSRENYTSFDSSWNTNPNGFGAYMCKRPENVVAFTFETAFFGTADNRVSQTNLVELGACFNRAIASYI